MSTRHITQGKLWLNLIQAAPLASAH